ncbi:hypothetical protein LSH36_218g02008 [Paralvinella palmiformis]|uniref:Cystinosin n=1 Tax=Paralvinella palmiformis TaxID=53620 RepID=A0AAD9JNY7_9ANNE|nr:hypothetical protein LSH36_218g02008 [Paralvinella palmiformis]
MPTSRCRTKSNEEICASLYNKQMGTGMPPNRFDYLNRKLIGWTVAVAAVLVIAYMSWDYWYLRKPQAHFIKPKDDSLPFEVSSTHVIFEIGSGSFISLTPTKPLKESAEIKIMLDDPDIIDVAMNSFTIEALSTPRNYFIPLHSKHVAGHCVVSFKTSSKLPELENLFKVRIQVKVVHEIAFGYLSIIIGWVYFCFWSSCYYPQIYQNFRRKSVVGFSFDYLALNLTGHICYCIFNLAMFYNSGIQKEYHLLHPKGELPVKLNDVLFSLHAISMNLILLLQCLLYERADQKVSLPMWTLVGGLWITVFCTLGAAIVEKISWLQYLYYLSYIKVGTTPIKYTPQVYLNYIRQSTEGWSIQGVILDIGGGIFSFLQMTIDAVNNDDWDGTLGNPGKLGLSCIAMIYDSIFMMQHFVFFNVGRKRRLTDTTEQHTEFLEKLNELKATLPKSGSFHHHVLLL